MFPCKLKTHALTDTQHLSRAQYDLKVPKNIQKFKQEEIVLLNSSLTYCLKQVFAKFLFFFL
jgi:hypothetical protein